MIYLSLRVLKAVTALLFMPRLNGICSDPFGVGSSMVRIHSVYTGPVKSWNGTVPYGITFVSGPIWYQIADRIRTGSLVNTRLICTNFVPVSNGSGPVYTLPQFLTSEVKRIIYRRLFEAVLRFVNRIILDVHYSR